MAIMDYTTFTEVDPGEDITVTTNKISVVNIDGATSSVVRFNGGSYSYLTVPFVHRTSFEVKSYSTPAPFVSIWAVSSAPWDSWLGGTGGDDLVSVEMVIDTTNDLYYIRVTHCNADTGQIDAPSSWWGIGGTPFTVYVEINYTSSSRISVTFYDSDPEHEGLSETISIEQEMLSTEFKYIYGFMTLGWAEYSYPISVDVGPLDIGGNRCTRRGFSCLL